MKTKILLGIASTLFLSACSQPKPISYESLSWVNNYYVKHPVQTLTPTAGGWLFRGARESGNEIRVGFLVPKSPNADKAKRHAVLDMVCPAKSEPIWQALPSRNKIVISVFTEDAKFKDQVIC
jgi:hypothetical protein